MSHASGDRPAPLTVGTAGHVDHGKTALVQALTGVDTDRLPEEKRRRLTIALGYAPLPLPSGRRLSLIDVPGHERFVRTMVSGATGIDAYAMVVAADDGVMPQTVEHATVLRALGVETGLIVITKADLADPSRARAEADALLPGLAAVECSVRTGAGIAAVRAALERLAARLVGRSRTARAPTRLHVDRAFTIAGRGTVLTGTLWSGEVGVGDALELAGPDLGRRTVRVRGVQVHDAAVERADAGQRVAVNITGARPREVASGDVLMAPGAFSESSILDCALDLTDARHGERVQVHHGTRHTAARLCLVDGDLWQLRLERPLAALDGDRLVVRRLAPPTTLGGGRVLDAAAPRHGRKPEVVARLRALRDGKPPPAPASPAPRPAPRLVDAAPPPPSPAPRPVDGVPTPPSAAPRPLDPMPAPLSDAERGLEHRLLDAGPALLSEAQLAGAGAELRALRERGRAVRVGGRLYAHAEVAAEIDARIVKLLRESGPATLAEVRDALGLSRKSAQAFLEHLDSRHLTRRLPDDRRVLIGPARTEPRR